MFESDVVLRDGSTLHLRPVRPQDRDGLFELYARLSPESRRFRFFATTSDNEAEVSRLLQADRERDCVLVAEAGGRISGVALFFRDPQAPDRAEVAFAIADALQGRGVGTRMLEVLAGIARDHRIKTFDAFVLHDNRQMMQVFLDSGFEAQRQLESGVFHVVLALDPTARYETRAAERSQAAATASMKSFFEPRTAVVIGANRERGKIGSEILHNVAAGGFTGRLFAVHPTAPSIDGVPACASVTAIPGEVDLAVICVPCAQVSAVVDECIAKSVKALVIISAGFGETGAAGRELEQEILGKVRTAGIRMIGPNCMGIINTDPAIRLNATFSPVAPTEGRVAFSTQSGALGLAILDYVRQLNLGISTFVSVGNKADVSGNDLIQYWADDPRTDVILLYLESFGNPRRFAQIARQGRREETDRRGQGGTIARQAHEPRHRIPAPWPRATSWWTPSFARRASSAPARSKSSSTSRRCWRTSRCPPDRASRSCRTPVDPAILAADACEVARAGTRRADRRDARGAEAIPARRRQHRQSRGHDRIRHRGAVRTCDAGAAGRRRRSTACW